MQFGLGIGIGHNSRRGGAPYVGPLDGYSTDLIVARSFKRRLLSSYEGPLFQLRRSSDNDERLFTFGDDGTVDLSGYAPWAGGDNIYVTAWYDQSGASRHGTQATTGKQPLFLPDSATINEVPCASFDGGDGLQYDAGSGNVFLDGPRAFIITAMSAPANGGVGFGRIISCKGAGNDYDNDNSCLLSFDNGGGVLAAGRNAALSTRARPTNVGFVGSGRYDSTQVFAGVDGTEGSGSNESGTFASRYLGVGEIGGAGGSYSTMKMSELLIWNDVPASEDIAAILADLKALMGVA